MMNSESMMYTAYPDVFTLSLKQDTFVRINLNRKQSKSLQINNQRKGETQKSSIEEFFGEGQESLKTEMETEDLLAFLDDFVAEKVQEGYFMLEEPDSYRRLLPDFSLQEEEEENWGSQMRNIVDSGNSQEKDKNIELEEEKIEDFEAIEKFECPLELRPYALHILNLEMESLSLKLVEANNGEIKVSGNQRNIEKFSRWFNEFLYGVMTGEDKIEEILEKKNEKIPYSMLYDSELENIIMKATALEVECLFQENQMTLTGAPSDLESFKAFLDEISHLGKKYMFPKYWDFSISQAYAEVEVVYGSEEWKEISKFFNFGFDNAQVTGLTRIQNYDLFTRYISTIGSKTELGPYENIQRKLLFHGTRNNDPSDIYKSSEVGFDMKFANSGGRYGKGIYFSTNSSYSHSFAHHGGRGTYKMLMADVYTGLSFTKKKNTIFSSLTDDQDSLYAQEHNFFVLFKNAQSYPLYLVEYTLKDLTVVQPNISQKHMTNILSGGQYCLLEQPDPELLFKSSFQIPESFQKPDVFCIRRLEKEFSQATNDEFLSDHFFLEKVEKPGCIEWLVSFIGFQDTPYEGGLFKMKVIFPATYPLKPPFIQFLTKIYHPCINDQGMVCMGLLSNWAPTSEVRHVLLVISCLLHDPSMEDPLVSDRMALYLRDRNEYMKTARTWTNKYACL